MTYFDVDSAFTHDPAEAYEVGLTDYVSNKNSPGDVRQRLEVCQSSAVSE
jgi:hypothetical protein